MITEQLSTKDTAYIATFGALWGCSEITLGLVLHNFHVPFSGFILTIIGTLIAFTCIQFTQKKRTIIYVALIAATIKMLSFTTIKMGPVAGILVSAMIGQSMVYILQINPLSTVLGAAAMCSWPVIQMLGFQTLIYTPKVFHLYQDFLTKIGLGSLNIWYIFLIIFLIHFTFGCIIGICSLKLFKTLQNRVFNYAKAS